MRKGERKKLEMSCGGMMQNLREIRRPVNSNQYARNCSSFADPTNGEGQPRPAVRRSATIHTQRFPGPTTRGGAREGKPIMCCYFDRDASTDHPTVTKAVV